MKTSIMPGFGAEKSIYRAAVQYNGVRPQLLPGPQVIPQACTRVCRNVVRPELCFFVPFPFCLIPQHECTTLCG